MTDEDLVREVLAGKKSALDTLVRRHQPFVYNVALRMFFRPEDAQDATQEVLIKMLTGLKSFEFRSQFRTWLYRLAVNTFLKSPVRKGEEVSLQREDWSTVPQPEAEPTVYDEELVDEVRLLCSTALLQCLSREQRLLYIVGEVFETDHQTGAALFGVTPGNYRVKVHRARADLESFVAGRCGLLDPNNPCRCPRKTQEWLRQGLIAPTTRVFQRDFKQRVSQTLGRARIPVARRVRVDLKELFQDSPFQVKEELDVLFQSLEASVRGDTNPAREE